MSESRGALASPATVARLSLAISLPRHALFGNGRSGHNNAGNTADVGNGRTSKVAAQGNSWNNGSVIGVTVTLFQLHRTLGYKTLLYLYEMEHALCVSALSSARLALIDPQMITFSFSVGSNAQHSDLGSASAGAEPFGCQPSARASAIHSLPTRFDRMVDGCLFK